MIMWLISAGLLAWIVVLFRKHRAEHHEFERYKFEHRTDGGVVEFANYEEKVAFEKREGKHQRRQLLILSLFVVFVICLSSALFIH